MKRLTVTGNVGRDPEIRENGNGNVFASFSVAVNVGSKESPKTDWIDITCNGKLVDVAIKHIKKGTKVLVDGFPKVTAYINRDSVPTGTMRLYAHSLEILTHPLHNQTDDDSSEVMLDDVASESELEAASA